MSTDLKINILHKKELLFSVSIKDCRVDTFQSSGPGGQHKNATQSAVRISHLPSGATGQGVDSRDQPKNKLAAFEKLVNSGKFRKWLQIEVARRIGTVDTAAPNKGQQIRTYHFKRHEVVDHRTNKIYNLEATLDGSGLDTIIADTLYLQ